MEDLKYIEKVIYAEYDEYVDIMSTAKSFIKFGRNPDLDSNDDDTVYFMGTDEVYATDNVIDTISSGSNSDTQEVVIVGHTIDLLGDFTRVEQTVILDGQNKVVLPTPLARVEKAYNNGSINLDDNVYIYEDGTISNGEPDDAGLIHIVIPQEDNESLKCAFTTTKDEYIAITALTVGANKTSSTSVEFKIQCREKGKVFRSKYVCTIDSSSGSQQILFPQAIIIPPNSDVRLKSTSSNNNTIVNGILHCHYAKKTYR